MESEGRYRGLLEAAPDAMVVVNGAGEIVLLNLQAEKQFGYHRDELVGQKVTNIIPDGFAERLIADDLRSTEAALAQEIGTGIELVALRKDGTEFPIEIMLSPLQGVEGILVTAAIRDISVRKAAASATRAMGLQMSHSAQHDLLTGLPNRMLLNDRIGQAIASEPRHAKHIAVLFLDLDGFKHINDSLGHPIGDRLLQSVARRLVECVRASDTVSRQGGDEFVVLLSRGAQWVDAATVAKRMLQAVAEPHSIDGRDLHITTSIGVSVYPDDGEDAETLIKNADTAMYQAKENGRHRYQFFTPAMNARAVERQSIEQGLRQAMERQEFVLHYQPQIDLRTGAISGAEALIRWMHPTRGLVLPEQFIPIAEDCGLILPIDNWVLRRACEQARAWVDAGLPAMTMAVNVSAMELEDPTFLEGLFAILKEMGLDPSFLEVELTESVLMKHAESGASILQILRAGGVQVAIDDFGTGYSSLSYLHKFAVDALKIDQSFVGRITSARDDVSLVAAVISMARSLKLRVTAEGVETLEQLAFLQALDCDEAQGFYFGRPVPAQQFAELLETGIPVPCCLALGQDPEQARRTSGGEAKGEPPAGEPEHHHVEHGHRIDDNEEGVGHVAGIQCGSPGTGGTFL
jgi:diguanylate cyclase (GGDEF)-like protein/PAS domain S-box-containing protein